MTKDGQRAASSPAGKPEGTPGRMSRMSGLDALRAIMVMAAIRSAISRGDDDSGDENEDNPQPAPTQALPEPVYAREAVRDVWRIERAVATEGVRIFPVTKTMSLIEKNQDGSISRYHDNIRNLSNWQMSAPEEGPFDYNTKATQEWTKGDELRVRFSFPDQPVLCVPPGDRYDFMATDCEHGNRSIAIKLLRDPEDGMRYTGVVELVDATHRVTHLNGASGRVCVPPDCPIVVLASDIPKARRAADCPASDCVFVKPDDPTPAFAPNTVYVWITPAAR